MFADDTKLYRTIITEDDTTSLQDDIDSLVDWSAFWQLPFNELKCKCMHIGKDRTSRSYQMNDHVMENVKEIKDLGVITDQKLKFHNHTSAAIKKNSVLGLIKRSFAALDKTILPKLYMSMVRPHLEYGNVIWGPHFKGDMEVIEKVQKRATRMIPDLRHLPYRNRLEALSLPSLSYRRRRGEMIMCYKIITNKVDINRDNFFTLNKLSTRGHEFKLRKDQRFTKQPRCQNFSIRCIDDWNSLPSQVIRAKSTNEFKNLLDKHWENERYESPFT